MSEYDRDVQRSLCKKRTIQKIVVGGGINTSQHHPQKRAVHSLIPLITFGGQSPWLLIQLQWI